MKRLSCLARNGRSPGEESRINSVAAQAIEAQPVFGQIKPSQRPGASRAETQSREKTWRISVVLDKRSKRFGVEKERMGDKRRHRQSGNCRQRRTCHRIFVGRTEIGSAWSRYLNEGGYYLSLKLGYSSFTASIYANLFEDDGGRVLTLARGGRENWPRGSPGRPARL